LAGHRVFAALHADAVVVARVEVVAGVPLHVGTVKKGVVARRQQLVQPGAFFRGRNRQGHFDGLCAREMLCRRDVHADSAIDLPFVRQFRRRSVALEVVRQYHCWVVPDVLVAGIARSDSDIRWRCRWCCARSEKCDYSRKRHELGTSDYCEPHECVCVAKSAPEHVAKTPISDFRLPPNKSGSGSC